MISSLRIFGRYGVISLAKMRFAYYLFWNVVLLIPNFADVKRVSEIGMDIFIAHRSANRFQWLKHLFCSSFLRIEGIVNPCFPAYCESSTRVPDPSAYFSKSALTIGAPTGSKGLFRESPSLRKPTGALYRYTPSSRSLRFWFLISR
jgi:hypothetical protein